MQRRAVIFDLFGTLIDNFSTEEYWRVLQKMADAVGPPREAFGQSWSTAFDQRCRAEFGDPEQTVAHFARAVGTTPTPEQISQAAQIRFAMTQRTLVPRPDALATLATLRELGYRVGLLTDCTGEVPMLWDSSPFAPLIDAPLFSCLAGMKKPEPQFYLLACERLGVCPQDCIYVADGSSYELAGATALGMHPVLISVPYDRNYNASRQEAAEWQGPTVSCLSEALPLVEAARRK